MRAGRTMKEIIVGDRIVILDDDVSIDILKVRKCRNTYYAYCKGGYLHRVIMGAKKWQVIDHLNNNGLDNRRSNLRFCTVGQNRQKSTKTQGKITTYRGVSRWKKRYQSKIWFNNVCLYLGSYKTPEDAAMAYDKKAIELFGADAYVNFTT